jgi:hypothetical protein
VSSETSEASGLSTPDEFRSSGGDASNMGSGAVVSDHVAEPAFRGASVQRRGAGWRRKLKRVRGGGQRERDGFETVIAHGAGDLRGGQRQGESQISLSGCLDVLRGGEGAVRDGPSRDERVLLEQAIQRVFERWTALSLAVTNGWGGPRSAAKRVQLLEDVLALFPACSLGGIDCCRGPPDADVLMKLLTDRHVLPSAISLLEPTALATERPSEMLCRSRLEDDFHVEAQDGSCAQVAAHIIQLWGMVRS